MMMIHLWINKENQIIQNPTLSGNS